MVRGVVNKERLLDVPLDSLKFFMKQQEMNCTQGILSNLLKYTIIYYMYSSSLRYTVVY